MGKTKQQKEAAKARAAAAKARAAAAKAAKRPPSTFIDSGDIAVVAGLVVAGVGIKFAACRAAGQVVNEFRRPASNDAVLPAPATSRQARGAVPSTTPQSGAASVAASSAKKPIVPRQ